MTKSTFESRLLSIFRSVEKVTDEEMSALLKVWKHRMKLKRNEFLVKKGDVETNLFYVIDGSMRIYFPHNDEEVCVGFAYENNLICSYPSFIQQKPSEYAIQALSKTTLMAIRKPDFYGLFDKYPKIERCWRLLQEQALVGLIDREAELLTFAPEERYQRLMDRSPHLFQIIPKKYIASYLRMSPETLSRMKPSGKSSKK